MQTGAITVPRTMLCCGCSFDDVVFMSEGIVVSLQLYLKCECLALLQQCLGLFQPSAVSCFQLNDTGILQLPTASLSSLLVGHCTTGMCTQQAEYPALAMVGLTHGGCCAGVPRAKGGSPGLF